MQSNNVNYECKKINPIMEFGNFKADVARSRLNDYFFDKSYMKGFTPSASEVATFSSCGQIEDCYSHVLRWFNPIKFFTEEERKSFRAGEKPVKRECESNVDLFGSNDEIGESLRDDRWANRMQYVLSGDLEGAQLFDVGVKSFRSKTGFYSLIGFKQNLDKLPLRLYQDFSN